MSYWYHHDQPRSVPEDFSTLEVVRQSSRPDEPFKVMQLPLGLEPAHSGVADLVSRHSQLGALEAISQPSSLPPLTFLGGSSRNLFMEKFLAHETSDRRQRRDTCGLRPRYFCFILSLIILTIAVLVGLAVGLTVGRHNSHQKMGRGSNTAAPTASNISSPEVPTASNTSSTAAPIASHSGSGVSRNSSLAAIAFNDTSGSLHYRVYYQDDTAMVKESSWNASTKLWQVSNIAIGKAKPKTPLAAIVTGPPTYAFVSSRS